jgi:mono/diheme cytochrome c family protein
MKKFKQRLPRAASLLVRLYPARYVPANGGGGGSATGGAGAVSGNVPTMRIDGLFLTGMALTLAGGCGIVALSLGVTAPGFGSGPGAGLAERTLSPQAAAGARIFYTGADADGPIPRVLTGGMMGGAMMGDVACVDCHGEDGRGGDLGMMGSGARAPDIRYSELTKERSEDGTTVPGWTDEDIGRAIREGVEPNGQRLDPPMLRWRMTDQDLSDVIAYLKELDRP